MSEFVPVNEVLLNGNEKAYLNQCIDSGWISSEGPFVRQFEEQFAARVNRRYGVSVSNGSVALQMAVAALGLGPGDEVIMPSFTFVSTANAFALRGAKPVFVDVRPDTLNLDEIERQAISRALDRFDGNISQAAAALGLTRPALYRRMRKHGL